MAEVAKLRALDREQLDRFGQSVSMDGDRLAVGTYQDRDNGPDSGSAYVFERGADGRWSQVGKLLAGDGSERDEFGYAVSLDGDRLAIGARLDRDNAVASGSAYVFERDAGGRWLEVTKLLSLDGQAGDHFGYSVSLDGDRLAIGSPNDGDNGALSGSVYVFERDLDGDWVQACKILPLDGQPSGRFGNSVSLDGDRLAIGAEQSDGSSELSGSVYVFDRQADGKWLEDSKLFAVDGQAFDCFGRSVSLDGDRLAIGADEEDDNGGDSGSAYVFERDTDGRWLEASKLLPPDGQPDARFGFSVSLDGDALAIGAPDDDNSGGLNAGSAYTFERDAEGWSEASKILPLDGENFDAFGASLALHGDRVAIGTDEHRARTGAVHIFEPVLVSPRLTLIGSCPGEIELTSTGTTPRSGARLYSSANLGTLVFDSGPCVGTSLDLAAPTLLRSRDLDFDAGERIVRETDEADCGTYLQVIDVKTCLTSGVVQVP